jgi:hypothetical protein
VRRPEYAGGARAPFLALAVSILAAVTSLPGCGYSSGFALPDDVGTVAVPIFRNETFPLRRDVELDLTRSVKEEFELRSDARVVSDVASADAILEGTVIEFDQGVLAEGVADTVQEAGIRILVRIRLVRTRDGSQLVERTISDYQAFTGQPGDGLESARDFAIRELARRIVMAIEPWRVGE